MAENTRERIIETAIACLAKKSTTGLDEIAKTAGVGRATLYRHFRSRSDLITAIQLRAGEQLHAVVDPVMESPLPAREKLVRIVNRLVPVGASLNVSAFFSHPLKDQDPKVMALYERHRQQARQLCLDLKAEGAVAGEIPLAWLISVIDALIFEAWTCVDAGEIAPKQAPWLVLETFMAGLGSPDTRDWFNQEKDRF